MSDLCRKNLRDWQTVEDMLMSGQAERPNAPTPHLVASIVSVLAGDVRAGVRTPEDAIAHAFDVGSVMAMLGYLQDVAPTCEHV